MKSVTGASQEQTVPEGCLCQPHRPPQESCTLPLNIDERIQILDPHQRERTTKTYLEARRQTQTAAQQSVDRKHPRPANLSCSLPAGTRDGGAAIEDLERKHASQYTDEELEKMLDDVEQRGKKKGKSDTYRDRLNGRCTVQQPPRVLPRCCRNDCTPILQRSVSYRYQSDRAPSSRKIVSKGRSPGIPQTADNTLYELM